MISFHVYAPDEPSRYIQPRPGETRLGERMQTGSGKGLQENKADFVLVGAPEDAGVRANGGIGGTDTAWEAFLKSFLNIQETPYLRGHHFLLYGHLVVDKPSLQSAADTEQLPALTAQIDECLSPIIASIVAAGKIPIVIGGGHNNAFALLKGCSAATGYPVNAINMDPHADFRRLEGRHSGNGFSYAYEAGYLKKYATPCLHEAYNNEEMINRFHASNDFQATTWEQIFLYREIDWNQAIENSIRHVNGAPFGVELDTDAIEGFLSSAATPLGIQPREAMDFLFRCGKQLNSCYLHLPEAIAIREDGLRNPLAGKMLSYLVQAFAKGVYARPTAAPRSKSNAASKPD